MTRPLVDTHPHVISPDEQAYPLKPLGGKRSEWSKERHAAPSELLEGQMTAAGVTAAAVVQSSTTYGHDNSYLADSVDRSGGRLTGVCSVGFTDDSVLDDIRYWIDERGMSGLRIFTAGTTLTDIGWLDDESVLPVWKYVSEQRIPVCVQTNMDGVVAMRNVLAQLPELVIVLDHIAMTDFFEGPPYSVADPVYALSGFPGVHLKVTTRTLRSGAKSAGGAAGVLRELVGHFGSERLVWGSNWPSSDTDLVALARLLHDAIDELPAEDADNIAHRAARRLYPKLAEAAR